MVVISGIAGSGLCKEFAIDVSLSRAEKPKVGYILRPLSISVLFLFIVPSHYTQKSVQQWHMAECQVSILITCQPRVDFNSSISALG